MNKVGSNILSLGVLQVANYLIPLLVIPIITRVLGSEMFGVVSYAQNIITYFTLLVNYGFEYSATRRIALAGGNKEEERRIFWGVIQCKILLLVASFAILLVLSLTWGKLAEERMLYFYTALINVGFVFFPTWYLQGVQDMRKMAWVNFLIKLFGALLVIALVRRAEQYRLYPLLLSLSGIAGGLSAFFYVRSAYDMGSWRWNTAAVREMFAGGGSIFINQLFVSLYTTINFTLLGFYLANSDLGYFSGAQRIILAANACMILPISTAIFPEMSRVYAEDYARGNKMFRRVLVGSAGISALACLLLYAAAPLVVRILLGEAFMPSVSLLRLMSPIPCLVMVASILTVQGLFGRGLQRFAPWVGFALSLLCIGLNMWLIPAIGMQGAVWAWIIAEAGEILIVSTILLVCRKCSI